MADKYIDRDYVDACLEQQTSESLSDDPEVDVFIEGATAEVAALLRNSGYGLPAPPIVVADVHPTIRDAVMCGVWERMALRPKFSLELPEKWAEMPYRRALDGIESGDLQLGSTQSTGTAPGSWIFSDIISRTGGGKLSGY